jgi:uncharacterized protein YacL
MLNFLDKYFTMELLKEFHFDNPQTAISKLIDKHELNPVARWIMHKTGLEIGMLIGFIATELLFFYVLFYIPLSEITFILGGAYLGELVIVVIYHLHWFSMIEMKRKAELIRLRNRFKRKRR